MSSLISSQKPDGAGRPGSSDSLPQTERLLRARIAKLFAHAAAAGILTLSAAVLIAPLSGQSSATVSSPTGTQASGISKTSARNCAQKIKELEAFASKEKAGRTRSTRFEESEINSYLELYLKPRYHPCLQNLKVRLAEDGLRVHTIIDFDRLNTDSAGILQNLIRLMFSGTHTLNTKGKIVSGGGKGRFQLDQASYDGRTLPDTLVKEIITSVALRQKPPFDPMQPSPLPFEIERVEVHPGYLLAHQKADIGKTAITP